MSSEWHDGDARERLYSRYVTTHLPYLRGEPTALDAKRETIYRKLYGPDLPAARESRILDLGCGDGSFMEYLRRNGYQSVEGVDRSREQIVLARSRGLDVEQGDVGEYLQSADPSSYDLVVALDLLEHLSLEEVLDLLDATQRALRPGGVLLFQSPCGGGVFGARYRYADLTHQLAFTERSAQQLLSLCGFEEVRVRPVRPVVTGVMSGLRSVVWAMGEFVFRLLLAAETGERRDVILTQNLIASGRKPAQP